MRTYDEVGRLLTVVSANDTAAMETETITYGYNNFGDRTTVTDALGNITTTVYDDNARPTLVTNALGQQTLTSYDAIGRVDSIIQAYQTALAIKTEFDYDKFGNKTEERRYDTGQSLLKTTTFDYDELNRLKSKTVIGDTPAQGEDRLDQTIAYTYDYRGRVLTTTDPRGNITTNVYDALGRLKTSTDAESNLTQNFYDNRGNLVRVIMPHSEIVEQAYDSLNRRTSTTQDGRVKYSEYNALNLLVKSTDFKGYVTTYVYDKRRKLLEKTVALNTDGSASADSYTTFMTYDANGNLLTYRVEGENGERFSYIYDRMNRKIGEVDGNGRLTEFVYDAIGNMTAKKFWETESKSSLNSITINEYDALNRRTTVKSGDTEVSATLKQTFAYDDLSRMNTATEHYGNEVTSVVDMDHNAFNFMTTENQTYAGSTINVSNKYDLNGNVTKLTTGSGRIENRTYNNINELLTVSDTSGSIANYTSYQNHQVHTATFGSGMNLTLDYNARLQESNRTYQKGQLLAYSMASEYDVQGNTTKETVELYGTNHVKDYAHDQQHRIATETGSEFDGSWSYDKVGNWVQTTQNSDSVTPVEETRTANIANEYSNYTYDYKGNLLEVTDEQLADKTIGQQRYEYDWNNRLSKVYDSTTYELIVEYRYDALNRRIAKIFPNPLFPRFVRQKRNLRLL